MESELLTSVKGRLRKPSAKALAAAGGMSSSSGVIQVSSGVNQKSILSLQFAVAETVVNDEELPFEEGVDARPEGITIETVALSDWRNKGFHQRKISLLPEVLETTGSEGGGSDEVVMTTPKNELDMMIESSSHSEDSLGGATTNITKGAQQSEVKRKRGRPFKGQEKPIEERLMIETSKIRRLIDDVMRKGSMDSSCDFLVRLRNVAAELDTVLATMPSKFLQPEEE